MGEKNELYEKVRMSDNTVKFDEAEPAHVKTEEMEILSGVDNIAPKTKKIKQKKTKQDRMLKRFGAILIAGVIFAFFLSAKATVNTSEQAKQALSSGVSTSLSVGTILLASDATITAQDYTITHSSEKNEAKIGIWDYAAEDGDYVQIVVNGTSIGDAFMIKHKLVEIAVPAVGEIQVLGVRDGGGGITYAIRYEVNQTTYFNSAAEGEYNTYTLVRE